MSRNTNVISGSIATEQTNLFSTTNTVNDGTGDPLNAKEMLRNWVLDNCANTDGISDEVQMAYLVFEQDLADEVRQAKEDKLYEEWLSTQPQGWEYLADDVSNEAEELQAFLDDKERDIAEGTECRNWDSSEECRDDSCLHHRIIDISEILTN
tara:strand:+ start:1482 stop:1940 length:459 start_codon:yes stop_codon:yes gene_type:complete